MTGGQRGFTVVEVVVVMTVLALLVWVALPRSYASDTRLQTLARQIQSDVRYAQELAMRTGQRHRIRFYSVVNPNPTNRYEIVAISGSGCSVASPCSIVHPLTLGTGFVVDLSAAPWGGAQLDGTLTLDFDSLGRPDAAKSISLNGGAKVVTVSAETGFVTP
jgi:prepilin-type N-terminal cleavage/methylation domain-containing protein